MNFFWRFRQFLFGEETYVSKNETPIRRLYLPSFVEMANNSVGFIMFQTFYIEQGGERRDSLDQGFNSCAFYVGALLRMFGVIDNLHGTISGLVYDLEASGWDTVPPHARTAGDVALWEGREFSDGLHKHMGIIVGEGSATSFSSVERCVVRHSDDFGGARPLERVFRYPDWESLK